MIKKDFELTDKEKDVVKEYQCSGCVIGHDISCYEKGATLECGKHITGTMASGIGAFFLGMPIGFCRKGTDTGLKIHIFKSPETGWKYDKFNVPVWKYLDKHGNTLVRGLSPRVNSPFLHVFIGNHIDKIDCIEISKTDIDGMD